MKQYDVIVIGTGGASLVADAALKAGKRVAVIEKTGFGGTCLTRGCIPTKVMVTAADVVHESHGWKKIGVETATPTLNWDVVSERVWKAINKSKGVKEFYESFDNADVYHGAATFVSDKVLYVTLQDGAKTEEITAPTIIIGTGGHSKVNYVDGLEEAGYITSEKLFGNEYPKVPYKRLAVFGGGPIGTEFAGVFAAAGTEVTLIQRNVRLLPKEDEAISAHILEEMKAIGVNVLTDTVCDNVRVDNGDKVITVKNRTTGEVSEIRVDEILVATGIAPSVEDLHLENTHIEQLPGGWIKTNEFLETSVEGVYALGDVNGNAAFRHRANYEGDIISHNLYRATSPTDYRWARYDLIPMVTFTYPEVGRIGMTEAEAKEAGYDVGVGINHYSNSAKGMALGIDKGDVHDGFIKVVVDKATNRLLGAHIVGPQASILFQPYVHLMNSGEVKLVPVHEEIGSTTTKELRAQGLTRYLDPQSVISIGEAMAPHPTLSEVSMWTQVFYENKW